MPTRSLNKVQLIGNLTRDPELRYTPQGTAVCTVGLATNRQWTTDTGEKREEVEFHRIVAWNKLAELCAQLLFKGRRVYVEGRLQTRTWTAQDGNQRQTTEIVINEMMILDTRRLPGEEVAPEGIAPPEEAKAKEISPPEEKVKVEEAVENVPVPKEAETQESSGKKGGKKKASPTSEQTPEAVTVEDIPF